MKKKNKTIQSFFQNRSKKFYAFIFFLSSILIVAPLFFSYQFPQLQGLGLLGILLTNFFGSAAMFIPAPSLISVVVGGSLYPPLLVALIATIGSAFGESVGFVFGLSTSKVTNFKKHKILFNLLDFTFQKYGWWIIIIGSAIPNPIFDGLGILAGLTSFNIRKFIIAVFIGRLIRNIALAYIGQAM